MLSGALEPNQVLATQAFEQPNLLLHGGTRLQAKGHTLAHLHDDLPVARLALDTERIVALGWDYYPIAHP